MKLCTNIEKQEHFLKLRSVLIKRDKFSENVNNILNFWQKTKNRNIFWKTGTKLKTRTFYKIMNNCFKVWTFFLKFPNIYWICEQLLKSRIFLDFGNKFCNLIVLITLLAIRLWCGSWYLKAGMEENLRSFTMPTCIRTHTRLLSRNMLSQTW